MTFNIVSKYTWLYLLSSLQTHTHTHTHTHCQNKPEEYRCMHEWCSVTHCNHFNIGSVQFSGSVASNSFRPHGLQHARSPYSSPTLIVYSNSFHWVSDAIQPFHPLLSPSPPAFNLSKHQSLFKWVNCLQQVATVLEFQLQHQSFRWIFRTDFL